MSISGRLVTNAKIRNANLDEFLHKLKYPFARRWYPRSVRRLIESVHEQIGWTLIEECERLFQASRQITITWLLLALVVNQIEI